jgi:hypothetical protein
MGNPPPVFAVKFMYSSDLARVPILGTC